jgi:hypothetical protein
VSCIYKEKKRKKTRRRQRTRVHPHPLPDDELLLLLEEEGVELVDLGVEEGEEVGLGGGGRRRGGDCVDAALELLVVEEVAPPLRQALLDLLLEPLPELHVSLSYRKISNLYRNICRQ